MPKKLISTILVLALLNIMGCYTPQMVTKEEFVQSPEHPDLEIQFQNNVVYRFDEGNYAVKTDTIYGTGEKQFKVGRKVLYKDYEGGISI